MGQPFDGLAAGESVDENELSAEELELRKTCFRVMHTCCANCLFGPQKLVSDIRKEAILQDIVQRGDFFVCHEGSEQGQRICCRAFYERYRGDVSSLQIAQLLNRLYPGSLRFVSTTEENAEHLEIEEWKGMRGNE